MTARETGKSKQAHEEKTKEAIQPNYEAEVAPMSQIYRLRDLAGNEKLGGDYGLALKNLKEATQMLSGFSGSHGPTDVLAFYELARTAESAGQLETAKQAYMEALNHDSRFVDIHIRLASLLAKTGDTKQALIEARKACDIDPDDPRGHYMLGLLLEHTGQIALAHQEKEKAHNLLGSYSTKVKHMEVESETENAEGEGKAAPGETQEDMPPDMPEGLP
jgi:tetratricopeptide (TPR) repeat protein